MNRGGFWTGLLFGLTIAAFAIVISLILVIEFDL